jgi:hypothetical protein
MPDITMCPGTNCPHKETCYRYTAKPSEYQSYFTEAPVKDGKCDMYWGENAKSVWKQINEIIETKK